MISKKIFAQRLLSISLLVISFFFGEKVIGQANSIRTGVVFNWADVQTNFNQSATLESIEINGTEYNTFVIPSTYELTRLGDAGHNANDILLNGTQIATSSIVSNWDNLALDAYQSLNLNHYFVSNGNGDEFCNDFDAINTNVAQIQTISFSPGIPSNPDGILAVTERGGNNCQFVRIYGIPNGGGSEQLLGQTFVRTSGNMSGIQPQAPPTSGSDYWSSGRNNENGQVIGIGLYELSDLAPVGSTITAIEYYGSSNDHGDGKFFLLQSYAVDDIFETEFKTELNGNVGENDNVPDGSVYVIDTFPTNGSLTLNPDGTFTYTPDNGFDGVDTFEIEVCLPAPNQNVCNISTVTVTVNEDNLPDATNDNFTVAEDIINNALNILQNDDFGIDGPAISNSLNIVSGPSNGSAIINNNGTPNNPLDDFVEYTPDPYFNGNDSFIYEIIDFNGTSDQATVNIIVTPDSKNITLTINNQSVNEDVGFTTVLVTIFGNYQVPPTINYETRDGTANNTQDFTGINNSHTFIGNNGETFPINIPIIDDEIIEFSESFFVDIISNTGSLNIDLSSSITIIDNDADPGVTGLAFDPTEVTVDEGAGTATFNVVLTGNFPQAFTVDFATSNGSATAGDDYTAQSGQLNFDGNDGEVRTITIDILEDDIIEATEDYTLTLSNPSLALVAINTANATGNITDNDADPGVTGLAFDPTEVTVNEGDGTATFNVVLTGNFPQAFTVDFATSNGSATAGDDFTAQTGQLNFAGNDGEVQTITIDILEDDIIEATEDYTLTLSNPSLALVAINTANATGNITDNDADPGVTGLAFDPTEVTVDEGAGTATFNVVLTGNFPQAFTVDFATSNGSATAGDDYTAQSGQLNFDGNDGEVRT
ncbi:Calx-beta domain-containing protein, partial [Croceivirga thetidis]